MRCRKVLDGKAIGVNKDYGFTKFKVSDKS
jgi:hypothetical protein